MHTRKAFLSSFLIAGLGLLWLAGPVVLGQGAPGESGGLHGHRAVRAARTEHPVKVDGNLDESAWAEAPVSAGFVQRDPQEGSLSTERTELRVLYTETTLYLGIVCHDSEPGGILARERRRDNPLENDDILSVSLDTFHDHRNSFLFRTNPLGTQYDALVTDEGRNVSANWDEKWDVAAQITPVGWVAEFAIPFKTLRVRDSQETQIWGLDVERVIRRKNELSYWNSYRRGFNLENASQAGHLEGLKEISTGLRLRVKPFLLGGFSHTNDVLHSALCRPSGATALQAGSAFCNLSEVGMEVMKYRMTPGLTMDLTWNTDFAQTAVDDQQVNLDRFPLFFPEKREFFQEGAGVYEFGIAQGEGAMTIMKLFHSRQIGLYRGQPVPIKGGGRITGQVAGLTVGLLNVQTEAVNRFGLPASNYGVYRVKRNVLSRSNVGGYLINRETTGSDFNRVYGMDGNFTFYRYLNIGGQVARSSSPGIEADNWLTSGGISWQSDFLNTGISWLTVDRDFRDDLGFVPRKNQRRFMPTLALQPRPKSTLLRQVIFRFHSDYTANQDNDLETRLNHYALELRFHSGDLFIYNPHTRLERLWAPFEIRPGIVIPPGTYSWFYNGTRFRTNPARRLFITGSWQKHYGFFGGGLHTFTLSPGVRLSGNFSVEADYDFNRASFPAGKYMDLKGAFPAREGRFTDNVINTRVNYNFNNRWLTSTSIQYNDTESFAGFNFRLNYIFRPGDNFYFIYNEGRRLDGPLAGQKDRSVQAKLTYSFDF
ncbi:MAG: carbohydrate binding family 9 domain-containing protein [Acidobacteria bacterium]|nr:carbohydrate binding family 9 domain-containing protein [Acidobacteriota bacterium]